MDDRIAGAYGWTCSRVHGAYKLLEPKRPDGPCYFEGRYSADGGRHGGGIVVAAAAPFCSKRGQMETFSACGHNRKSKRHVTPVRFDGSLVPHSSRKLYQLFES